MIANEQQEDGEEASTVVKRMIQSKRRIENIETDNMFDLDRIEAKVINNDVTFSELGIFF